MSGRKKSRDRKDYTKERTLSERRLDALARLLTGNSECVAVSIIDGKFYIAANEFSRETLNKSQQQLYDLINEGMFYFQKIAKREETDKAEDEEIFKQICKLRKEKAGKTGLIIPSDLPDKIVTDILLHCRCMLEQASEIFVQHNPAIPITLKVRGKHDLNFEENWICPSIFHVGYEETEASAYEGSNEVPQEITIQYKIGQQSCTTIKDLIKSTKNPSKTSMYPSQSSSEDETELAKKDIESRLDSFKTTIKLLENIEESSNKNTLIMLNLAKTLHENAKFIDFCQMPHTTTPEILFIALAKSLKSNSGYSDELLSKILKSRSLVGETTFKYFRSFSLHPNQAQQAHLLTVEIPKNFHAPPASMEYSESSSRSDSHSYKDISLKLERRLQDAKRPRNMNDTYSKETPEAKRSKTRENYHVLLDEVFTKFSSEEAQLEQALKEFASTALKKQAEQLGFTVVDVTAGDGNCFFHAVVDQIHYAHQIRVADLEDLQKLTHSQLRELAIAHLLDHQEDYQEFIDDTVAQDFNSFIEKLMQGGEWADHVIITALSHALNINLEIIRSDAAAPNTISVENPLTTLHLAYIVGLHYQSLHRADPLNESSTPTPPLSPER